MPANQSLRQLRSGKEFSPWSLGHPTKELNIGRLLDQDQLLPPDPLNEAAPIILPPDFSAPQPPRIDPYLTNDQVPPREPLEEEKDSASPPSLQSQPAASSDFEEKTREPSSASTIRPAGPLSANSNPSLKIQAKRARERARKKNQVDPSTGREAERRMRFILKSFQIAHDSFVLSSTIHSTQGYVGVPDQGQDWPNMASSAHARFRYLREVGGYMLVDTTINADVDYPFVDAQDRVWAVALAEPNGWDERRSGIQRARNRLDSQLSHLKAPHNRRGDFRSYQSGFSFGMGRTLPMNFVNTAAVEEALAEFFADSDVQALFHYVEGALRTWFPEHYECFHNAIKTVQELHPELKTPVPGTSFAASTVNVGKRVVCLPHRDASNEAAAVCLDYVDGPYNPDTGGHLVFHEARRIIKLRQGGAILFPSAIITHENIDIAPTESRFSITAYLAGALSRYLAAGGRTLGEWKLADAKAAANHEAAGSFRWETGCAKFKSTKQLTQYWEHRACAIAG